MSDPESSFAAESDSLLRGILGQLDSFDPDELEADYSAGVLKITFADRRVCILNRQGAARQIWLAEGASAWHFERDPAGRWVDTKGRGGIDAVLSAVLTKRMGRVVAISAPSKT